MVKESLERVSTSVGELLSSLRELSRAVAEDENGERSLAFELAFLVRIHPPLFGELDLPLVEGEPGSDLQHKELTQGPSGHRSFGAKDERVVDVVVLSSDGMIREVDIHPDGRRSVISGWPYSSEPDDSHRHAKNVLSALAGALARWAGRIEQTTIHLQDRRRVVRAAEELRRALGQ